MPQRLPVLQPDEFAPDADENNRPTVPSLSDYKVPKNPKTPADIPIPDEVRSGNFTLVVSLSGGKDSACVALALKELGLPYVMVFADTGWEHPATYAYVDYLEAKLGQEIIRVRSEKTFAGWVEHYKMFPGRTTRFCTEKLKLLPILDFHEEYRKKGIDTISVVGIRHEESAARSTAKSFEDDDRWGGYIWRPIVHFDTYDVISMHHRHDIGINPLYKMGHNRVGCYPCIFADRNEIRLFATNAPERLQLIRDMEAATTELRKVRNDEALENAGGTYADELDQLRVVYGNLPTVKLLLKIRDEVGLAEDHPVRVRAEFILKKVRPYDLTEASFFTSKLRDGKAMGIDRVVQWAMAEHGGKDHLAASFFEDKQPDGGCFRWGFCEPPTRLHPRKQDEQGHTDKQDGPDGGSSPSEV